MLPGKIRPALGQMCLQTTRLSVIWEFLTVGKPHTKFLEVCGIGMSNIG